MRFATLLLIAAPAVAQTVTYTVDTLHSTANFAVRHMMISTVRGHFGGVKGVIKYDPRNPGAATIDATIDCSTVNSGEPKRDSDLKGPEFFDVKKYPEMKFKSKKVEAAGAGKLKITGDLTINATTRQVVLDVEGPTAEVKDTRGRFKVGANAATKISRKDFGIVWNQLMETGGVAVSDEVSISLDLELTRAEK